MVDEEKIVYTIRKSRRAKRVRISVYCDGGVAVTVPMRTPLSVAEEFVEKKMRWIRQKVALCTDKKRRKKDRLFSRDDYEKRRGEAYALASRRIAHFCALYGLSCRMVFIKNQKTKWGSCSEKKNININYKVVYLPRPLQEYIFVHEVCHLKEMNHSEKFWSLVAREVPDYKERRKEMRKHKML